MNLIKSGYGEDIRIDFSNCSSEKTGATHGISIPEHQHLQNRSKRIFEEASQRCQSGEIGFVKLPFDTVALQSIIACADTHKARWEDMVVFGIGGSALGITMLFKALCHPFHNLLPPEKRNHVPRLFVSDNIDPEYLSGLSDLIRDEHTLLIMITKSGGTIETWGNFYQYQHLFGMDIPPDRVIAITDPCSGYLRQTAQQAGWGTLDIPSDVGGRFSVLTPVGLFPAAMLGIDIQEIMAGAQRMHERCRSGEMEENPALQLAAIHTFFMQQKNKTISVMMPYCNALLDFADWYRQLWAESLGKKSDIHGNDVFYGQTPVKALGATDQHSQLQLYNEGPNDKVVTFLEISEFRAEGSLAGIGDTSPFIHLSKLKAGEVLNIELSGTRNALTENQRPNLSIIIPRLTPYSIGQLIYLYEMATFYAGLFLGINPFDQPGVESGKRIANRMIASLYEQRRGSNANR